jgi:hypothetical protein
MAKTHCDYCNKDFYNIERFSEHLNSCNRYIKARDYIIAHTPSDAICTGSYYYGTGCDFPGSGTRSIPNEFIGIDRSIGTDHSINFYSKPKRDYSWLGILIVIAFLTALIIGLSKTI